LHPEDRAGARAAWAGAVASEGDYEVEYRIRRGADGSHRWFLVRGAPLRGPDGRIERWIGVGVDIDDRRRAEEALRASEERFRRAMGIGTVGVHFFGLDGRVTDANRAFERMSGYTRGELLALGDRKVLTPPEFSDATGRAAAELAASGETAPYEKQMVRKDGSRWWGLFAPTRLAGYGRGAQCVEFVVDVTERKRAEGALRASEGRLRDLLATLDLGASMARDLDGTIRFWSEGCARLYGWSAAEAVGQDAHALLRTAFPVPRAEIGAALERDGEWTGDLRQWTRDGAEVVVAARKMMRRDPDGRPVAVLESLTDVSAQRLTEAALRASEARLRELQAELLHVSRLSAAGEMAAVLAHELNQPLTAAASAVQAARRTLASASPEGFDGQPPEVREAMDLAAEQARRAGQIVRRLRDFVARGEADPRLEGLPRLVEESAALALVGAAERGVVVSLRVAPGLPPVLADRIQIEQVLFNLMRNALEAMDDGEPAAGSGRDAPRHRELVLSAELAGPGEVEIAVADTGPGLAPEVAGRLFEPFVSTKAKGMGVGLSICRSIVEAHGGRLWAEPNPEGGSVFRFTLPAARSPETGVRQGKAPR
jgi:two-component system, LuxR family, sensor kinase FixL